MSFKQVLAKRRISEEWEKTSLREHMEIKHGFAFKGQFFTDDETAAILLTPGNFNIGGGFNDSKLKYYRGEELPPEYILKTGDIIVTMTDLSKQGDTLGYPARVPFIRNKQFLHNQRLGKIIFKKGGKIHQEFIYWLLRNKDYRNEVLASATGTTVKHTSPDRILKYSFYLPSLSEQSFIADILDSLDDKIELNRQMNATLEKIGEALFKHWFIDFEFPNEKGKPFKSSGGEMVDSELGEIPKGWEVRPFSEVIAVNPRRSMRRGTVAKKVGMSDLARWQSCIRSWSSGTFASGSTFKNGDTLFARITPCLEQGKTAFVSSLDDGEVAFGSTEFIVLAPKAIKSPSYIFFLGISDNLREGAIISMTGTSGRQRVPNGFFDHYLVAVPPETITSRFEGIIGPLMFMIKEKAEQVSQLEKIRNSLLPRLMSGRIRIQGAIQHPREVKQ